MPSVMNMVIMCHAHHSSTEKDDKNLQTVPKSTPKDTDQTSTNYTQLCL